MVAQLVAIAAVAGGADGLVRFAALPAADRYEGNKPWWERINEVGTRHKVNLGSLAAALDLLNRWVDEDPSEVDRFVRRLDHIANLDHAMPFDRLDEKRRVAIVHKVQVEYYGKRR